jgi:RHS repeat-associated protein
VSNSWTGEQVGEQGNFDVSGISYDGNGNILSMQRRGLTGILSGQNQYSPMDQLRYAYQGNQLKAVDDEVETPDNKGDFEDNGSKYNGSSAEYVYDANGNLTLDQNKGITGIAYNHLNLPVLISFGEKGSMEFVYSAAGVKLKKIVREAGKPDAITDYSGGFVYQNDTLQFVHAAEGRVLYRPQDHSRNWAYEYHYQDHLGNTRLAFRKQEHEVKVATLEPSRITDEQADFDNIVETRSPDRSYNGNYSSRLSAAENKPLGPLTMLPVQRGDSLTMSAFGSYQVNSQVSNPWTLAAFVSSLFNSTALPPTGMEGYRNGKYTPYIGLALGGSIAALQSEEGVPNAYLKYIVLNQDSQYVYSDVQVISSAAGQNWQELKLHYKAEQNGFVQVFVYNESGQEVFFDDVTIRNDPALIVQENHYDPWGLNLVGIEKEGRPDHKFQYNGKEKQVELGLHWNDFDARHQDPQLGRFLNIDPSVENYFESSPYGFVLNNPLRYSDPTGMDTVNANTNQHINKNDVIKLDGGSYVTANTGQTLIAGNAKAAARDVLENSFFVRFMAGREVMKEAEALDNFERDGFLAYRYTQISNAHQEIGLEFSTGGYLNPFFRKLRISAESAVWSQKTFSNTFSSGGRFAGQTIDNVSGALRNGALSPADLPIDVVVRNGQTFILNTRSSVALTRAGIPRNEWNTMNRTGMSLYENLLSGQLRRNGLPNGTGTIRQSGTNILINH